MASFLGVFIQGRCFGKERSPAEGKGKMKIVIIGSTQYRDKIIDHKNEMQELGFEVSIPAFDDFEDYNDLAVAEYNRAQIITADEIHLIWDGRSIGTIFDFGMVFALQKPLKIIYIEPKTIAGIMRKYEEKLKPGKPKGEKK